ncbi:MAG: energy transducer TonB [Bacteroidota bacterium]
METLVTQKPAKKKKDQLLVDQPLDFKVSPDSKQVYQDMISLKSEKADRESRERLMYFFVGLSISLALIIGAFEYKSVDDGQLVDLIGEAQELEVLNEVPPTEQPPPPPPKNVLPEVITEVANDEEIVEDLKIEIDMELTEDMAVEEIVYEPIEEEEEKVEEIFSIVETLPEPVGGFPAFYAYIAEHIRFPREALRNNVGGRVFVQFVVEKDGSLTNFVVVKGIGNGCDEEAIRVLSGAPNWSPGKQRGIPVRVYKTLPIFFELRER